MIERVFKILFACLALVTVACSDDDNNEPAEQTSTLLSTDSSVVNCESDASTVSFVLSWQATTWSIEAEPGKVVAAVAPTTGGSNAGNGSTTITVEINANTTGEVRTQSLVITDNVGAVKRVLLRQAIPAKSSATVAVNPSTSYQYVAGFGAMYNPYIWTGSDMPTAEQVDYCYSPEGLGYTIMRLMVYPKQSQWNRDVEAAKIAQSYGALIFACPWHCDDQWRDKATVNGKEYPHLKPENYGDYAQHLVDYVNYMKENGVSIYALSVQNEPDGEFTYWTANEIHEFVAEYGAKIRATGVKLMAPECMGVLKSYTNPLLSGKAWDNTDIVATHTYTGYNDGAKDSDYSRERRAYMTELWANTLHPAGKQWWMTEHLFNDGSGAEKVSDRLYVQWNYCLDNLGREIHNVMNTYSSAYLYWYLRRDYGLIGSNESTSPVPAGQPTANGYIMAHYAQYASNTTRIEAVSDNDNVYVTAYSDAAGNVSVVMLNFSDIAVDCVLNGVAASTAEAVFSDSAYKMVPLRCSVNADGGISLSLNAKSITSIRLR
jgi:glucuronoarabinoxylan endo-1,4-beta-xylanase